MIAGSTGLQPARADGPLYDWTGFYIGGQFGGALDLSNFSDPYGPSIFGDNVRSPGPFAGGQIGVNYQSGLAVVGLRAELAAAHMSGTFTCLQPARGLPGFPPDFAGGAFGATCQVEPDLFGTLAARAGLALGPQGRIFLYGVGGLAWMQSDVRMAVDNSQAGRFGPQNATSHSTVSQVGWTLGGGVEYAMGRNWSLGFEYDYLGFGDRSVSTPVSGPFSSPGFNGIAGSTAPNGTAANLSQDVHAVKLTLNYQLGGLGVIEGQQPVTAQDIPPVHVAGFERTFGGRYVYAWTTYQQDLGRPPAALPVNNSRLTWQDLGTSGGEFFWRVDAPENVMVKGFVGYGQGRQGHIYDEDWGNTAGNPVNEVTGYQVTDSSTTQKIGYATIDLGYDVFRSDTYKLAPFFGYNYLHYKMNAWNCTFEMFVPPQACNAAAPPGQLFLQETDTWISLRLGAVGDMNLTPRLKLTAEAAYLPYVRYYGEDNHPLRPGDGPSTKSPAHGLGSGVQLEGLLSYDVTDWFTVGAGARYWSMNIPSGTTNFFSRPGDFINQKFSVEQTAVYAQGAFKFDGPAE
jgi:opacity protein-like surface antigen